ncbi:hypothetical protein [Ekhidna sp.]
MNILLASIIGVPVLFLIVVIFHYRHLKYLLLIWTREYLEFGEILTDENSVTYFESLNTLNLSFRILKTERKYPQMKDNEKLMKKIKEYRIARNCAYLGIILFIGGALIAQWYFQ